MSSLIVSFVVVVAVVFLIVGICYVAALVVRNVWMDYRLGAELRHVSGGDHAARMQLDSLQLLLSDARARSFSLTLGRHLRDALREPA